jgi:membrane associated rhomboid family serine protease
LIAANIVIFFLMVSAGRGAERVTMTFGVVPARLLSGNDPLGWLTLVTSMFLHGGWAHLFSNVLALYIFGDNVEDRLGSVRYLLLYLLSGLAAGIVHIVFNPTSTIPAIGASGAISGVLAAYFLFFPTARVITLVPLFFWPWFVEIPAVVYLGFWFVSQLLNGVLSIVVGAQALGGVAWWAHVGGFAAGLVLGPLLKRRRYVRRVYVDEYFPW